MTNSACIFCARGIGRRANNAQWLFRDISLEINHGDRIGIVGPSGSGKSLLLRSLARLDPLDAGEILWKERPVVEDLVADFRSRIVYLQQTPVLTEGTVEEVLQEPYQWLAHRLQRFDRSSMVRHLKDLNRTEKFLWKTSSDLSGGEKSIVAFLRAFQFDPPVMLLDEPTAALDDETARAVEDKVSAWTKGSGFRAFAWVGHDRTQIDRIANRVIEVDNFKIQEVS